MAEILSDVIKSRIVIDALNHVVDRTEVLNSSRYPVKIIAIGIGGSALRKEKIGDVDITVHISEKPELVDEWKNFKENLLKRFFDIWSLIEETREIRRTRITIHDIVELYYDYLIQLGFKELWIEWLKWTRISDFKWGINRGLPFPLFPLKNLLKDT